MKIDRKLINKISIGVFLGLIIVYGIWAINKTTKDYFNLSNDHRFTIGIVDTIKRSGKGWVIFYNFNVNKIHYNRYVGIKGNDTSLIKKTFYLMFYTKNPNNSKIMLNCPVPDSIKVIPEKGWVRIPLIDQNKKRYDLNY